MKNLSRLLKIARERITRNPYHALAAFLVMFLTFFVAGAFVLAIVGSNVLLRYFESRPAVNVFLKDGTSTSEVKEIQNKLEKTGVISKLRYISKEEAVKIYKDRFKSDPILTFAVTAEILPASFEISTYNLEDLAKVADSLKDNPAVEEIVFPRNIVETLGAWTGAIRNIGVVVVLFLLTTSFLTTLIVIGLNIALHQDEIEIMRLVGATSWYIRIPFILEGIFYGAFSAFVAAFFLWGIFAYISPTLQRIFSGVPILTANPLMFVYLLVFEVFVGGLIGVVGSMVATRKYLNI